jgi:hypothetical protein
MQFKKYVEHKDSLSSNVTHTNHGIIGTYSREKGFISNDESKFKSDKNVPKGSQVESEPISFRIEKLKLTKIK